MLDESIKHLGPWARASAPPPRDAVRAAPLTLPLEHPDADLAPVDLDYVLSLPDRIVRSLAGNSMVLPAVGSVILFLLVMSDWVADGTRDT